MKNKHLTLEERYIIQHALEQNKRCVDIAALIEKDPTTVSKEIRNHLTFMRTGAFGRSFNDCISRSSCHAYGLCDECTTGKRCRSCPHCSKHCTEYIREECPRLRRFPYVCNGCSEKPKCTLEKHMYRAMEAQKEYEAVRSESRTGIDLDENELARIDGIVSPLLQAGHSPHAICTDNASELMISEKTLYNYLDASLFRAKNLDLPRKVKFKRRKERKTGLKIERNCRIGRTIEDFETCMAEHPGLSYVEMDSVEGRKGGKVLLTIHFPKPELLLAFMRDANTAASVEEILNQLEDRLGYDNFSRLFPVILTDNGSEFSNPTALEKNPDGISRTRIFYCNPSAPYQKGSIEVNHEMIRRIIPKGKPLDNLTQEHIDTVITNINSYTRGILNNRSAYEMFVSIYGQDIADLLGLTRIPPNEVILTPSLLKPNKTEAPEK